jgi:hypothetical protein
MTIERIESDEPSVKTPDPEQPGRGARGNTKKIPSADQDDEGVDQNAGAEGIDDADVRSPIEADDAAQNDGQDDAQADAQNARGDAQEDERDDAEKAEDDAVNQHQRQAGDGAADGEDLPEDIDIDEDDAVSRP